MAERMCCLPRRLGFISVASIFLEIKELVIFTNKDWGLTRTWTPLQLAMTLFFGICHLLTPKRLIYGPRMQYHMLVFHATCLPHWIGWLIRIACFQSRQYQRVLIVRKQFQTWPFVQLLWPSCLCINKVFLTAREISILFSSFVDTSNDIL